MARLSPQRHTGLINDWISLAFSKSRFKRCYNLSRSYQPSHSVSLQSTNLTTYATRKALLRQASYHNNPHHPVLTNRCYSTGPIPRVLCTPPIQYFTILALILGLGSFSSSAIAHALENVNISDIQKSIDENDPLDALLPENLKRKTTHIIQKSTPDLLRSYLTLVMCEIPWVVTYGSTLLNVCASLRDHVPIVGPIVWSGLEWIIYSTFFTHYVGGQSIQDCQPVIESLHDCNIGALLNYSVEALEKSPAFDQRSNNCQIYDQGIQTISEALDTLAKGSITSGSNYDAGSAQMKPIALAIKISGLVTDPYLFERASENLASNHLSPFKAEGAIFPIISNSMNQSDPLFPSDHIALENLMNSLRYICRKAQAAHIVLMMDAEYSWFQPALDRIVTFLSAEFNQVQPEEEVDHFHSCSPTVFNTFQTLLRSTPARLDAFLNDAEERGYSIGIKLVRGAYLTSETNHWQERKSRGILDEIPVWSSKSETDNCFDSIASNLVSRLSNSARQSATLSKATNKEASSKSIETSLVIAGHNSLSVLKVLKQLRDKEGLAVMKDSMGTQSLQLSNKLRGQLMFAQLYGMADNLTTTLTQIISSNDFDEIFLQPFVFKYLPFGPVDKVLPYLARRAEENQSILQSQHGHYSSISWERKLLGHEIRKRFFYLFSFF